MWRVSSANDLSPFAYATLIRRLPPACECLVACVQETVVGYVVAYRSGRELVILDLEMASDILASRLLEILHAVASWPSLRGATVIEADERCIPHVRDVIPVMGPAVANGKLTPPSELAATAG